MSAAVIEMGRALGMTVVAEGVETEEQVERLRTLEKEGRITFEDTALVERDPDGTAHVRNEVSGTTETDTVVGAVIGGLIGFMFPLLYDLSRA